MITRSIYPNEEEAMVTITIELSEEQLRYLSEIARQLGIRPEELVRASIQDLLARPDQAFEQAVSYVLEKNAELYRRLA